MNYKSASFPFKSGLGDIHAQEEFQKNLEPLPGTKIIVDGDPDYRTGEEFDADWEEEREHVKGTKYRARFETQYKLRKQQLRDIKNLERIEDIISEEDD